MRYTPLMIVLLCISFMAGLYTQATLDRRYTSAVIDTCQELAIYGVNITLAQDGYKIYFRTTEHGQLALVHPAEDINYARQFAERLEDDGMEYR